jgi:predicted Zn-dependent protease
MLAIMRSRPPLLLLFVLLAATIVTVPYRRASGQGTISSDELAERGQTALASGRFDQAEAAFVQLAKLEPSVAEVHATLGAVYFQEGKIDAAIESLRRALRLKPTLSKSKVLLAICLSERGDTANALQGLEAGFRTSDDPQVRRMCGLELLRAYSALHRDADAVNVSLTLNKQYPDDPEVLYQTGRIFGNYTYLTMVRLRDKAPDSVWTMQAAAEAQESEKDYDAALNSYANVLRIEPRRTGVHYRVGRVHLARFEATHDAKDRDLAEKDFQDELSLDPDNGNAAYELAQIHHDEGSLAQAEKEFGELVIRRPNFEQARVGFAGVLIEVKKPDSAVAQLKRAVELDANDAVAWYRLARTLRLVGDVDGQNKALAEFRRLHALEEKRLARAGVVNAVGEVTPQQLGDTTQP